MSVELICARMVEAKHIDLLPAIKKTRKIDEENFRKNEQILYMSNHTK